jgi:hypothetical protein
VRIPYEARPGGGFMLLMGVLAGAAVFLGWGLQRPALDRVWELQIALELGQREALSGREFKLLQDALVRHPGIAESMLEGAAYGLISASEAGRVETGYAYLVRRQASPPLSVRVKASEAPARAAPLEVRARVLGQTRTGTATAHAPFEWIAPQEGPFPQLIEIRVSGPKAVAPVVEAVELP